MAGEGPGGSDSGGGDSGGGDSGGRSSGGKGSGGTNSGGGPSGGSAGDGTGGTLLPPPCQNGEMDGDESDVDCGGSCDPCAAGDSCLTRDDCDSGVCASGLGGAGGGSPLGDFMSDAPGECLPPECGDGVINGDDVCDDGNTALEACEYGEESCEVCGPECTMVPGTLRYCGDGVVDEEHGEECELDADHCTGCKLETTRTVNGLTWYYEPGVCGKACNDVCAAYGLTPVDTTTWFNAQDEAAECAALAEAFGMADSQVSSYTYACLETSAGATGVHDLPGPLLCSSHPGCPSNHLTNMDKLGVACGETDARRSICPCE